MDQSPQRRALANYRNRLSARGMARFEVLGLHADRELIRTLARRLAADDADAAARLRGLVTRGIWGDTPRKGGILAALRGSPLVGADLDLERVRTSGRDVDL